MTRHDIVQSRSVDIAGIQNFHLIFLINNLSLSDITGWLSTCPALIRTEKNNSERPVDALAVVKVNHWLTYNLKSRDAGASKNANEPARGSIMEQQLRFTPWRFFHFSAEQRGRQLEEHPVSLSEPRPIITFPFQKSWQFWPPILWIYLFACYT